MELERHRNGPLELLTWLLRTGAPAALHGMGLGLVAGLLEELEPVHDASTARAALRLMQHARASVATLKHVIDMKPLGDAGRAVEESDEALALTQEALVAGLAYALGAKTADVIQNACLRIQAIASRWGKDVPPPTIPSPMDSERDKPTAPSKARRESTTAVR